MCIGGLLVQCSVMSLSFSLPFFLSLLLSISTNIYNIFLETAVGRPRHVAGKFQMFWLDGYQWFGAGMDVTLIFASTEDNKNKNGMITSGNCTLWLQIAVSRLTGSRFQPPENCLTYGMETATNVYVIPTGLGIYTFPILYSYINL